MGELFFEPFLEESERRLLNALTPVERQVFLKILGQYQDFGKSTTYDRIHDKDFLRKPVPIEQFFMDDYYFGLVGKGIYPVLLQDLKRIFSGSIAQVILSGSIGWGKSFLSQCIAAYLLYYVSCMRDPQDYFKLAHASSIVFCNLSVTGDKSNAFYVALREKIDSSPYFKECFPRLARVKSAMIFPNQVTFISAGSQETGAIGENVLYCLSGDTKISSCYIPKKSGIEVLDVTIRELAEYSRKEKPFQILSATLSYTWPWMSEKYDHELLGMEFKTAIAFSNGVRELVKITLSDGSFFKCTPDHKIAVIDPRSSKVGYVEAKDSRGEILIHAYMGFSVSASRSRGVINIEYCGKEEVYDISVEDNHNFYIDCGKTTVLVHNCALDEANFMQRSSKSVKKKPGQDEYNQALELYNSISRRLKSRFLFHGSVFGKFVIISSKRYPNDFVESLIKSGLTDTSVIVLDYATWDVKLDTFTGEWFHVYVGKDGDVAKPRILADSEVDMFNPTEVIRIPIEYRPEFEQDLLSSIRDIAGRAILGTSLFIPDTEKVKQMFDESRALPCNLLETNFKDGFMLNKEVFLYSQEGNPIGFKAYPEAPRFVHFDFSKNSDRTGCAIGCFGGYKIIERVTSDGNTYLDPVPRVHVDLAISFSPDPKHGEIDQSLIFAFLVQLRDKMGVSFRGVSADSYQSVAFLQQVRAINFETEEVSLDRTPEGYTYLKRNIMAEAISCHSQPKAQKEVASLDKDKSTGKVDHPSGGSKDISDCLAGITLRINKECVYLEDVIPAISDIEDKSFEGESFIEKLNNPAFFKADLQDLTEEEKFAREAYF